MRIPIALTLFLNATSIPSIVIERAIATYFSSRYEKFGKSIAVILIVAQSGIGIGSFLFIASNFKLFDPEKAVYCFATNDDNKTKVAVIIGFYMTIDFISRFHSNKIYANLSHRYQIMENINSLQVLSPMIVFHSLFMTVYLGAIFLCFVIDFNFSYKQYAIYLESSFFLLQCQS
uniref:G-protein coupled receptors family 1 profile domain-containing protein n=1 Tax=Onchocerca volvulus TaxID=6282 RepID=A0A8R1XWZ9_ONCVO